jgi:hypothetical protein
VVKFRLLFDLLRAPAFFTMRSFALPLSALVTGTFATYSDALQNILMNTDKTNKYHYPTDFTREIVPKPFHSHNDYWRDVPFYTGLSYGAISTEADVWLINDTLYVGRLKLNRSFLYSMIHSLLIQDDDFRLRLEV